MPNHVTNRIYASDKVIKALSNGKELVDFAKIVPRPDDLESESIPLGAESLAEFVCGKVALNPSEDDLLGRLSLSNITRDLQCGGALAFDDETFEMFIAMVRNIKKHGYAHCMRFATEKWGTKWNAYDIKEIPGCIEFQTAWAAPHPVIEALAEMFPEEKICHCWADEDIGSNLGKRTYSGKNYSEQEIDDGVDFALTLNESCREYYRKNSETGKWEHREDDRE